MNSLEIRKTFIDSFLELKGHEHTFVPSAPVAPLDDPTLLFTNAGMNQFKDIFLGKGERKYNRAVNSQKCIRVSGKHNDLEEVGPSPIHHTFFEMLGNWSFGDYFKAEAINWAWTLMTEVFKMDKSKLYATVFQDDDEAFGLWKSETDIDPSHISRHGHKDNFWEMGAVGPCGPCSELHYDLGKPLPGRVSLPNDGPNTDSGRYIELWNLVFIQYQRDEEGVLHELPAKHVDTGAGLERIARVMQGINSNYQTDLFQPIISEIENRSQVKYEEENGIYIPHRVIADHLRALSFAIADGVLPSNDGRGYVLRRILRRAARFCRQLDLREPFLYTLVPTLVEVMGTHFQELNERIDHITHVIKAEEESFGRTLDRGIFFFEQSLNELKESKSTDSEKCVFPGDKAFQLYDTYGFPLDLTELMAREASWNVDVDGFKNAMEQQRENSRKNTHFVANNAEFTVLTEGSHSEFVGYDTLKVRTGMRMIRLESGKPEWANDANHEEKPEYAVILAKTPFYAESGGQSSDWGTIRGSELHLQVVDVRQEGDLRLHICRATRIPEDDAWPGMVEATVDIDRRKKILPHHTTTHLLQAALRKVLGDHVHQAGSKVTPDYMTFDFTHFEKPTEDQLQEVEDLVNEWIREDLPVKWVITDIENAKAKGAMALFGEKYGDEVRMVMIGHDENHLTSLELCGGTHLDRTGEAGIFRIESETGISAGVRRIESTSGLPAYQKMQSERHTLNRVIDLIGSRGSDPSEKLEKLIAENKKLEKEAEKLKKAALQGSINFIEDWAYEFKIDNETVSFVSGVYEAATDRETLQSVGDKIVADLTKAHKPGIGLVGAQIDDTFIFVAVVTPDLVSKKVHAGKLIGAFAKKAGGGGGGKPNFATAGSKNIDKANAFMKNRSEVNKFAETYFN